MDGRDSRAWAIICYLLGCTLARYWTWTITAKNKTKQYKTGCGHFKQWFNLLCPAYVSVTLSVCFKPSGALLTMERENKNQWQSHGHAMETWGTLCVESYGFHKPREQTAKLLGCCTVTLLQHASSVYIVLSFTQVLATLILLKNDHMESQEAASLCSSIN